MTLGTKSELDDPKDCIMLIRVSTPEQATADKGGIDSQLATCKKIARQHNLNLRWPIQIDGVSGAAVQRAPGFKLLLQIVQSGACSGIVLKDSSRLMRPDNFADQAIFEFCGPIRLGSTKNTASPISTATLIGLWPR
jgi:DNA invertase Pin-like site-specific DNA recombinase